MRWSRTEFLEECRSRGIDVRRQHVDHAIRTGRLTCRLVGGWRVFGERQVRQMEAYRRTVRAGRPRKPENQGAAA